MIEEFLADDPPDETRSTQSGFRTILDEAERQLNYALRLSAEDYHTSALVNQRIQDIATLRRRMEL